MAKPVLVINYCIEGLSKSIAVRNLRDLQAVISESNANDDYYVFLLPVTSDSHIQVFYEKDFKEINYQELKKMIEDKFTSFEKATETVGVIAPVIELEEDDEVTHGSFFGENIKRLKKLFR
jgi:hypothetical protein